MAHQDDGKTLGRWGARTQSITLQSRGRQKVPTNTPFYFVQPRAGGAAIVPMRDGGRLSGYDGTFGAFLRNMPRELGDSPEDRVLAYKAAAWVNICVNRRAQALAAIPRVMRKKDDGSEVPDHNLLFAINESYRQFHRRFVVAHEKSILIHGEAFIEPIYNGYLINSLRVLNPLAIQPDTTTGTLDGFFYYDTSGRLARFSYNELIFDMTENPASDLRGESRVALALDAINVSRDLKQYVAAFMRADGIPAGIISARQGFSPTEKEAQAFLARWNEETEQDEIDAKFDIRFIPGAFQFERIQREPLPEDVQLTEDAKEEICAVLEVPRAVAGAVVDANYQTAQQRLEWHESIIYDLAVSRSEFINTHVKPRFDPLDQYCFEMDINAVLDRLGKRSQRFEQVSRRYAQGEITFNEARKENGEEPIAGGDFIIIPQSMKAVPVAEFANITDLTKPEPTMDAAVNNLVQAALPSPKPVPVLPTPPPKLPQQLQPRSTSEKKDGVPSATAILKPSPESIEKIKQIARTLRESLDIPDIQWSHDYDYHITLVHAPLITNDELDRAISQALPFRPFTATAAGVSTFDNDTIPIIIPIDAPIELREYQRDLYGMAFSSQGVVVSGNSDPENWKPHITLGYAPPGTELPDLSALIEAQDLVFDVIHFTRPEYEIIGAIEGYTETAEKELSQWFKKSRRAFKANTLPGEVAFTSYLIPDTIAGELREALKSARDMTAIKAAFDHAKELLSIKAIQATRLDFENAFDDLLSQAIRKQINRRTFSNRLRALIRNAGRDAYRDGLTDGGLEVPGFDDDDLATINRLVAEQTAYVSAFGELLFKGDGISATQADSKASTWYNKSIDPFYRAGVGSADRNGLYVWVLGRTEKHCGDCSRLEGQKHRMRDWLKKNWVPRSEKLKCEGFQCDCNLKKTNGKASGRF